jgi:L-threonylcarbamoyladenylate synthase
LPTETVYGLAAKALDIKAVGKIFAIKGRPLNDPLILHILESSWLQRKTYVEKYLGRVTRITNELWPGAISLMLLKKAIVPDIVTAGFDTVAVQHPTHQIFQAVLRDTDLPLAVPSANPFGYVSPTKIEQVRGALGDKVKIMIDEGECAIGLESTILHITQIIPKVLKAEAITVGEISEVLGEDVIDYDIQIVSQNRNVPGQLKQHYCTNTRLVLFGHSSSRNLPESSNEKMPMIFLLQPND